MIERLSKKRFPLYKALSLLIITSLFSACVVISSTPQVKKVNRSEDAPRELIRVQVLKALTSLSVKGTKNSVSRIEIADNKALLVDGKRIESVILTPKDGESFVYLDGKPYRGTVEVHGEASGLSLINELYLEDYLAGLINNEISSSWPRQSVRAQAVIARTYALVQKKKRATEPFHLSGTDIDQVYKGSGSEDNAAFKAVRATTGEVLTYRGELALTLYHSNAGGRTEAAVNVWGSDFRYLRSVVSPYDRRDRGFEWTHEISSGDLTARLVSAGIKIDKVRSLHIKRRSKSKRVVKLQVVGKGTSVELSGERLRAILGYGTIRSTLFKVRKKGKSFVFTGKGSGHGVGLSQWGAKGMAEAGRHYRGILSHYYPGTKLKKIY
jgi:stage II sporulation protein D